MYIDGIGVKMMSNENVNSQQENTESVEVRATFDDILKDKDYQSAFDKKIAKALETSKSKWEAEYTKKLEDARTEAEKLSSMKAEEKAQYELKKKQAEYDSKLKELTTRELKAEAKTQLSEVGLPKTFESLLNYESAETVSKSIDSLKDAFFDAVQKEVSKKIGSLEAPKKSTSKAAVSQDELYNHFIANPTAENWAAYQKSLNK